MSTLNTEADRWDGGIGRDDRDRRYGHGDRPGRQGAAELRPGGRSNGPDGLPKNTDDIVVTRSKKHGKTTLSKEAKAAETVGSKPAEPCERIRKGLGFGVRKRRRKRRRKE